MRQLFLPLMALFLAACSTTPRNQSSSAHNSRNALDWQGRYSGVLPCADCSGQLTTLVLSANGQYQLSTQYLGKSTEVFRNNGTFSWNKEGNTISLAGLQGGIPAAYRVGENNLTQLDASGNVITGALASRYILSREGSDIRNRYWKLVEAMGKPVSFAEGQRREAHMILHLQDNRVTGNGSCNSFTGGYQLSEGNRISFPGVASTKMACPDMETESLFFKALQTADSYSLQGDSLQLNRARMAPLARFVAVYLR